MNSLNSVQLIGNLTRDPQYKEEIGKRPRCTFSIATNEIWKDKDGVKQTSVDYHSLVSWGPSAEIIAKYTKKGSKMYIEGKLKTNSWEGEDGTKRNETYIIVSKFLFLDKKNKDEEMAKRKDELDLDNLDF